MSIRRRQAVFGLIYGAGGFAVAWLLVFVLLPSNFLTQVPRWRAATLLLVNAHYLEITGLVALGLGTADFIANTQALGYVRAVALLSIVLAGALTADAVGRTSQFKHYLENSAAALAGYLPALTGAIFATNARPAIQLILLLAVGLTVATYVGAGIAQKVTGGLPIFAITSLGGLAAIGLLVLVAGSTVIAVIWRGVAMTVGGATAGGILLYSTRFTSSGIGDTGGLVLKLGVGALALYGLYAMVT